MVQRIRAAEEISQRRRRRGAGWEPATMDEVGTEWAKCGEIRAWMTQSLSNRIGGRPLRNRLK